MAQPASTPLARLRASPFAAHARRLAKAATPCVTLTRSRGRPTRRGASRLGGEPDVPTDFEWPTRAGRPLSFLAQLDLAALPAAPGLPRSGWLLAFLDLDDVPPGFDPSARDGARLVHLRARRDRLAPRRAPPGATRHRACVVEGLRGVDLPAPDDTAFSALGVPLAPPWEDDEELDDLDDEAFLAASLGPRADEEGWAALGAALRGAGEPHHHLLGEPQLIQNCMRLKCQLASNGVDCGQGLPRTARARRLAPGARDWRLLLQLDSDPRGPGWRFGDAGRLFWWIRAQDLAARRFDAAWFVFQCH